MSGYRRGLNPAILNLPNAAQDDEYAGDVAEDTASADAASGNLPPVTDPATVPPDGVDVAPVDPTVPADTAGTSSSDTPAS